MFKALEIASSSFLHDKKEKIFFRLLEILPGFISLFILSFAFLFSFLKPFWVAIFIILFSLYWCLRTFYLTFLQILCYFKMKKNLRIDWEKKIKKLPNFKKIYHLVVLPVYREEATILQRTLKAIKESFFPLERILVIVSFEEKERKRNEITKEILEKEFEKKIPHLFFTFHQLKEGEVAGRGSNIHWAIEMAKKEILPKLKVSPENILCSNFDSDTVVFPHYFNILSYFYLKEKNYQRAFQPIPIYNNNILSTSFLSRICAFCSTFWQMMQQEKGEGFATFSSHAVPLRVLNEIGGYPQNVIPDDSHLFWKSFLYYEGKFKVVPIYYPVLMDAVDGKNLFSLMKNLYEQQKRWAWGVSEFPFLVFNLRKAKRIPLSKKILNIFSLLEGFLSWATACLLLFFLGWLPLVMGNLEFNRTILAFNLPYLTRTLMTIASAGLIVCALMNYFLLSFAFSNKKISFFQKIKNILQWVFLPVILIVFGSFPALDAQLTLMFKKNFYFQPTEKYYGS
ncbi:MAG: hypothetical protein ACPLZH_00100 [Minisyncoccales bacterium]